MDTENQTPEMDEELDNIIVLNDEDAKYYDDSSEGIKAADVYSNDGAFKYTKYWRDKEFELQSQVDELGYPTVALVFIKELKLVKKILLDLNELLEFIKDNRGLSLTDHIDNQFRDMVKFMKL